MIIWLTGIFPSFGLYLLPGALLFSFTAALPMTIAAEIRKKDRRWLSLVFGVPFTWGIIMFLLVFFAGPRLMSDRLQWPAGTRIEALALPDKEWAAVLPSVSRIQIYDAEGRYLRGWFVPNPHTNYRIQIALPEGNQEGIEVRLPERILMYSASGRLLSEIGARGRPLPLPNGRYKTIALPMRWFEWFFVSPVYSWLLAFAGVAGISVSQALRRKRRPAGGSAGPSAEGGEIPVPPRNRNETALQHGR